MNDKPDKAAVTAGRSRRALLAGGVIGPPLFVIAFLLAGATRPDYSPLRHPVSSLAIGDLGWIQVANFLVTGLLLLGFAVGFGPAFRRYGGGNWEPRLIGLIGVGLIGAGVFVSDPMNGYPPGTPLVPDQTSATVAGQLHDTCSGFVFLGLPSSAACWPAGSRGPASDAGRCTRSRRPWCSSPASS